MLLWSKTRSVVSNITVEPVIILYYIAFAMSSVNEQSLLLQKVCHPGVSQPPQSLKCETEADTQKTVTFIQTWRSLILHVFPILFVLFAGSWSDNHGKRRKPLMYLPVMGQILADLLCLLNIYFWSWPPEMTALSSSVLPALTGWRSCFNIGMLCYMSDASSVKSRTWRIGVCVGLVFLGMPIGTFLFGSVFHFINNQGIYIICVACNSIALICLTFAPEEIKPLEGSTYLGLCGGVFNFNTIKDSIKTTFSARPGFKRCVVLLMLLASPVTMNPIEGEYTVLYFFLRYKFDWNEKDYGLYAAYRTVAVCLGTIISMGIFSRLLQFSDAAIGMMSSVTFMVASVGYTFADQSWQLYVYPIVDFMQGAGLAVVVSIVSKTVESHELGQVNSVIGVVDAVFPLFNIPLYTQVYNHTFTKLAGGFFLISFTYGTVGLVIFSLIYILMRKQDTKSKVDENENQG